MNNVVADFFEKGGITIYPLIFLSVLSLSTIIERSWFWGRMLLKEGEIINRIMDSASRNLDLAAKVAREHQNHPIGNYLYAPLRLSNPDPEVFHLAIESAADEELAMMRRGDKILEAVIALSPLLGLLGTVFGLIGSLKGISLSDMGTAATEGVTLGISEALISTATGLVVAIFSLAFYRLFQGLWFNQVRVFRKAGSELELIYRQRWMDREDPRYPIDARLETSEKLDN